MSRAKLSSSLLARRATVASAIPAAGVFETGGREGAGVSGRSDFAISLGKPSRRLGLVRRWGFTVGGIAALTVAGTLLFMNLEEHNAGTIARRARSVTPDAAFAAAGIGELLPRGEATMMTAQHADPHPVAPAPRISAEEVVTLLTAGNAALRTGDVTTARLYFERATEAENPQAALRLGNTYDPGYLVLVGLSGVRGDAAVAARWYRYAQALGSVEAGTALVRVVGNDGTPHALDNLFDQFLSRTGSKGR